LGWPQRRSGSKLKSDVQGTENNYIIQDLWRLLQPLKKKVLAGGSGTFYIARGLGRLAGLDQWRWANLFRILQRKKQAKPENCVALRRQRYVLSLKLLRL
jgi:hypothetical protein